MNRRHFLRNGLWVTGAALGFPAIVQAQVMPSARRAAATSPSGITYLYEQDWEGSGKPADWNAPTGTGTIDYDYTDVVLAGTQSLYITGKSFGQSWVYENNMWIYMLVQFETLAPTQQTVFGVYRSGYLALLAFQMKADSTLVLVTSTGSSAPTSAVTTGVTYHVWLNFVRNGTCSLGFSTDGTRPTSGDTYRTQATGDYATYYRYFNAGTDFAYITDNLLVSTNPHVP